jgi:hypothetical protein
MVTAVYANGDIPVDIEIHPDKINSKSRGLLSVAIFGTADFDVTEIDPIEVFLYRGPTQSRSFRWRYSDYNKDGYMDMIFKFKIVEDLLPENEGWLYVIGFLLDGETTFIGEQWVTVIP